MEDEALYTKFSTLPSPIKIELLDYLEFLIQKNNTNKEKIHPKAGCMKGTFIMSDDFNATPDCFKDYMT